MNENRFAAVLRKPFVSTLIAILLGFLVGAVVIMIAGYDPLTAYSTMFSGVFASPKSITTLVVKATPLICTGLCVAFAFRTGLFDIGAEGQYIIGAVTAVLTGYSIRLPAWIHIPVVFLSAMLASGLWGGLSGWLKARMGIHEVISGIMLNWIALYLQNYLITMPWLKKEGTESSYEVLSSARITLLGDWKMSDAGIEWCTSHGEIGKVLLKTDVNFGILIAIAAAVVIAFILKKTTFGYQLRAVGLNRDAAEAAGINVRRNTVRSMAVAGALAGLAGCIAVTGASPFRISTLSLMEGFGFDGMSVALIANSAPAGCILSAFLLAGLRYGGQYIQSRMGVPSEVISVMLGTIVFLIAISTAIPMIVSRLEQRRNRKC